jgi:L-cysteine:1D-myo-inositol 2-amino-2-deoxy-alpha-D-glucopyranoside ligase
MQLYNVLTRQIEQFKPSGDTVTVYVCGITPYDTTHLGHLFTYTTFDVLIRYLEFQGYPVRYVQNVTDLDDDILRRAGEIDQDWKELGDRWTVHFIDDNLTLNLRPPDFFPRATDVIDAIISAVQALLEAGVAYESGGSVYFHIASDPDYGKLSRLAYDEMLPIANERGNFPDDPQKRDPLDFVLWQTQSPGEPAWDSPWGPGRPGWHIECSTMSAEYLGQSIDIHGGGADLIFPHHESEIAQSECAGGSQPFARFWLHTAMVRFEGEKMSKSLGNLVMVRDLLEAGWPADAIRICMANHHYREAWNYVESDLDDSLALADKFREAVTITGGEGDVLDPGSTWAAFKEAMEHDLDSPVALQTLSDLADSILSAAGEGKDLSQAQDALRKWTGIFGLRLDQPDVEKNVSAGWEAHRKRFIGDP